MQKDQVSRAKLASVYHTTPFKDGELYADNAKVHGNLFVGMDVNSFSDDHRHLYWQGNNLLNGGGVLRGASYFDCRETDRGAMRAASIAMLDRHFVAYTDAQLDTAFARNGYVEPDKICEASDVFVQPTVQQAQFDALTVDDLHPHVLRVLHEKVRSLSRQDLVDQAKAELGQYGFDVAIMLALIDKSDEPLIAPLIIKATRSAYDAMRKNTTEQARVLLKAGIAMPEIISMATDHAKVTGAELTAIIFWGQGAIINDSPIVTTLLVRSSSHQALVSALEALPVNDWIECSRPYAPHVGLVDIDLTGQSLASLVTLLEDRIAFSKVDALVKEDGGQRM